MELGGRVALVTGANRGIGAATAQRLAVVGAAVALAYGHDGKAAERVAGRIESAGRTAFAVAGDVRDPAQIEEMVAQVESSLGPVDILVSNAGIARPQALEEITVEDWDEVMEINLSPLSCSPGVSRRACASAGGGG